MRIFRDNPDDHDPEDFDNDDDITRGEDPKAVGDIIADEFADYLASVVADAPPPTEPDAETTAGTETPAPILRLVKDDDTTPETEPDNPEVDPREAARAARKRLIGASAKGSAVVIGLGVVAGWGEPPVVVGPLAVYGTAWLAYLWWNAALRPPIPQAIGATTHAVTGGIAAAASGTARTARRVIHRVDRARERHETTRTASAPTA